MSERYTKVFDLPKNMYAENAPVVISAGALLKDNQTGTILAQLKIKNITNKVIKAAKISILSFDTIGKQIDDETKHEYLDLSVGRDYEFGQKVPITLSNNSTRSFSVTVNEIIFADNSIWNYGGEEWAALKEANKLISVLSDSEVAKQFKIEYGEKCEFEATEEKDIWICSCGKINKKEESKCFHCGCYLQTLKNVDLAKLNENKDIRVAKEREQAAQANTKRNKLIALISVSCIVVIVLSIMLSNYIKKVNTYNEGIALLQSNSIDDMNRGSLILRSLGEFKDSEEQIYNRAMELVEKEPSESIKLLEGIGGYKDSREKVIDMTYDEGLKLFETCQYAKAFEKFEKCGDYKDSKEKKQESLFYNYVIEANFYEHNIIIDGIEKVFNNAKPLVGDNLKNKIVGSWLCRSTNKATRRMFNADGSVTEYAKYYKNDRVGNWTVENDELKYFSSTYKFYSMSDEVLLAYDPETKYISAMYIAENSDTAEKCLKKCAIN